MAVSELTFQQLALEDPEGHWELHCGFPRRKPDMTAQHNEVASDLYFQLRQQLDKDQFTVRLDMGRVRLTAQNYYIPDVYVVPTSLLRPQLLRPDVLEAYDAPLPLVVEV